MTYLPANTRSPFLPTSQVYPEDLSQLLITMTQVYIDQANAINIRQIGIFDQTQSVTGQQFFNTSNVQQPRLSFRKVFSIGAIAAGATSTTAHGLTGVTSYTHIYATAVTVIPDNRPIPYNSATLVTDQVSLTVTATNIVIVNGATAPNITSAIVVLEFLLN